MTPIFNGQEHNMNAASKPISVLLVDDHTLFRSGIRSLLQRHSDFSVVGEAADGVEGIKRAKQLRPDVVLLDLNMPGMSGPRLFPEFSPVIESTEFGRSLPRFVASATAALICCFIQIWLAPTGAFTSKVGMPVSWQIAPSPVAAWSMFWAMIVRA